MNTVTKVFAAHSNSEIDEWDRRLKLNYKRWQRNTELLRKDLRISDLVIRTNFTSCWIAGYRTEGKIVGPRIGFRRDKKLGYLVPDEYSEEGKAVAERLKECSYTVGGVPGLPDLIKGEELIGPFKLEKIGDSWFATLSFAVTNEELAQVDSEIWSSVSIADYQIIKSDTTKLEESSNREFQDQL